MGQSTENGYDAVAIGLLVVAVEAPADGVDVDEAEVDEAEVDAVPVAFADSDGVSDAAVEAVVADDVEGPEVTDAELVEVSVGEPDELSGEVDPDAGGGVVEDALPVVLDVPVGVDVPDAVDVPVGVDVPDAVDVSVRGGLNGFEDGVGGKPGAVTPDPVGEGTPPLAERSVPGVEVADPGTLETGPLVAGPPVGALLVGAPAIEVAWPGGAGLGETPGAGSADVEAPTGTVPPDPVRSDERRPPELGLAPTGAAPELLPGAGAWKISWAGCCS